MPARHLALGAAGEKAAAEYLQSLGWVVKDRNWQRRGLELDLVCLDPGFTGGLVFVEVKARRPGGQGSPAEAVHRVKRERLIRAASLYLSEHRAWNAPCRFDVIALTAAANGLELEHIPDAFALSGSLGGRYAPWQPW